MGRESACIAVTTDNPTQRFLSLTSAQQPSIRQPFRQHHEPRQPEALLIQAEADQQAVSLGCDTGSRQANGSHVNVNTNIQQERQRLYAPRPLRAHTLSQQREERTRSQIEPTTRDKKTDLAAGSAANANAGNRPAGMLPLNRLRSSQYSSSMACMDMLWWTDALCEERPTFPFFPLGQVVAFGDNLGCGAW